MSRRTKKVGSSGRYGTRYGLSVKKQMKVVEANKSSKYTCPRCSKKNVKRVSAGVWECRSCELKFTGGAYQPVTGKFKLIANRLGSV
jgi:large subunit ribosomal protein L37Ae